MAAGGVFTSYNKVLPGSYINFVSKARSIGTLGERGIVALPLKLDWGENDKILTISNEDFQKRCVEILGYDYSHEKMLPFREIFKNASCIKLFRIGKGTKATATIQNLTVSAKCFGTRGNSLKIKISQNVDNSLFNIFTILDDDIVFEQSAENIEALAKDDSNPFVTFSGSGSLNVNAGTNLLGGQNSEEENSEIAKFLTLIEAEQFNVLAYFGEDAKTKAIFESFTKRLRNEEGIKISLVLHDYKKADFEGIISVKNSANLVFWTAGAIAGAYINESLTNKTYDGEYVFDSKFSNSKLKEFIQNGEFVFYFDGQDIKVLKDINTLTSFTANKNSDFCNNQVIRVLDLSANDISKIFNDYYIGKVQNNELGRDIFKSELIDYFRNLQSISAIEDFKANDISIKQGIEKGDVVVGLNIKPVSAMDKLYMECIIE